MDLLFISEEVTDLSVVSFSSRFNMLLRINVVESSLVLNYRVIYYDSNFDALTSTCVVLEAKS